MIKRSIASVLDQALLSGLNFSIGLYLISKVPKDTYGLYVQLFAVGVLFCGVLDALVANALANLRSKHSPEVMAAKTAMAQTGARLVALVLTLVGGAVAYGLQWNVPANTNPWWVVLAFVAYVVSLTFRDFKRVTLYLEQRSLEVLKLDGLFVALALMAGVALHFTRSVSLVTVFLVLALANAVAMFLTPRAIHSMAFDGSRLFATMKEFWGITRWALPGLALGWLGNSFYLYAAGFQLGLAATAELNASRLLLMPVALLTVAWQQMARPEVAKLIMLGEKKAFGPFLGKSAGVILVPMAFYLAVLFMAYKPLSVLISAEKYVYFSELLILWIVYLLIYVVKFVGTVLMVGFGDFLALLKMNVVSLGLQAVLLIILMPVWGIESVVFCLMASELLEAALIWGKLLPQRLSKLTNTPGVGA